MTTWDVAAGILVFYIATVVTWLILSTSNVVASILGVHLQGRVDAFYISFGREGTVTNIGYPLCIGVGVSFVALGLPAMITGARHGNPDYSSAAWTIGGLMVAFLGPVYIGTTRTADDPSIGVRLNQLSRNFTRQECHQTSELIRLRIAKLTKLAQRRGTRATYVQFACAMLACVGWFFLMFAESVWTITAWGYFMAILLLTLGALWARTWLWRWNKRKELQLWRGYARSVQDLKPEPEPRLRPMRGGAGGWTTLIALAVGLVIGIRKRSER